MPENREEERLTAAEMHPAVLNQSENITAPATFATLAWCAALIMAAFSAKGANYSSASIALLIAIVICGVSGFWLYTLTRGILVRWQKALEQLESKGASE